MRPTLRTLQAFTNDYFRRNSPKVNWRKDSEYSGYADFENNRIYICPSVDYDYNFCTIGGIFSITYDEKLKLRGGEQYFLILLHEIGHYKITKKHRIKLPKGYKQLRARLKKIQKKRKFEQGEFEYRVEDYLERYYKNEYLLGAVSDFYAYYRSLDYTSHHLAVDEWAREQFKKRRNEIRAILRGGTRK